MGKEEINNCWEQLRDEKALWERRYNQLKSEKEELQKMVEEILEICNYTSMINDDKVITIRMKLNRLLTNK